MNLVRRFQNLSAYFGLVSKYTVGLKTFVLQGLSEPEFMAAWCIYSRKIFSVQCTLCCSFCVSSYLFHLRFNFDCYISKIMHLWARTLPRKPSAVLFCLILVFLLLLLFIFFFYFSWLLSLPVCLLFDLYVILAL